MRKKTDNEKLKNIAVVSSFALALGIIFALNIISPDKKMSASERRYLAELPKPDLKTVMTGRFMEGFESYALDQFPARDSFRRVKNMASFYVQRRKDVNGLYMADGHLSKIEYPLNEASVQNASDKFKFIYEKYLEGNGTKVYLSVIPDKNYFMASKNGYPSFDYGKMVYELKDKTDFMEYIDIFDCLSLSDYYRTDSHWRQEKIIPVAKKLADKMGITLIGDYEKKVLDKPFYGVYHGQSALPFDAEDMVYLENDVISEMTVYDYELGRETGIYNMKLANGRDPYEMFLSGSKSILKITNPSAGNDKRLIIFRDSYGSSIAPVLATGYKEVTLIDIRYISSQALGDNVDFSDCDVLFLYSTQVLNNSVTLK